MIAYVYYILKKKQKETVEHKSNQRWPALVSVSLIIDQMPMMIPKLPSVLRLQYFTMTIPLITRQSQV